jgi:hypothetical protein
MALASPLPQICPGPWISRSLTLPHQRKTVTEKRNGLTGIYICPVSPISHVPRLEDTAVQPESSTTRQQCDMGCGDVGLHRVLRCPVPPAWWCRPPGLVIGEPEFRCRPSSKSRKLPAVPPAGTTSRPSFRNHPRIDTLTRKCQAADTNNGI